MHDCAVRTVRCPLNPRSISSTVAKLPGRETPRRPGGFMSNAGLSQFRVERLQLVGHDGLQSTTCAFALVMTSSPSCTAWLVGASSAMATRRIRSHNSSLRPPAWRSMPARAGSACVCRAPRHGFLVRRRSRLAAAARCAARERDFRAIDNANARLTAVQRPPILGLGRLKSLFVLTCPT